MAAGTMGTAKSTPQEYSRPAGQGAPAVVTSAAEIEDGTVARREIIQGLSARVAAVSPKYFYDPLGSCLFQAITQLPEYYPTRTEKALMQARSDQIAETIGPVTSSSILAPEIA